MKKPSKYEGMTREQLEAELDHRQEMIRQLGETLANVQIQNVSLQIQVNQHSQIQKTQQQQMMELVEQKKAR
jgi:hypothetical protein